MWSLACPTLQQRRDTEGQPQLTVLQPLPLLAARKRSPAPQSHPSQHILKSKKKNSILHHLLGQALVSKSGYRSKPCYAWSEATRLGSHHLASSLSTASHRAWLGMRSGHRSAWGDKGRPGSRQRSCAPPQWGRPLQKTLGENAGTYSPGVICWSHLTSHIQENLKISRPACLVANGFCSSVSSPA